jgi:uncharacterized protein
MPADYGDIFYFYQSLILEGAPFILLGAIISGLIDAYLPAQAMDKLLPKSSIAGVLVAGLLGIGFPVCECAIVPVIRRLVSKGLPVSCAIAYMLASPIVNPLTAFSTFSAFQQPRLPLAEQQVAWGMTSFRLIFGYVIAVVVGLILSRLKAKTLLQPAVLASVELAAAEKSVDASAHKPTEGERLVRAMRTAQKDFLDVAMYFTIGVLIAAFFKTRVVFRPDLQEQIYALATNTWAAPLVLMALAFALSLCSTTDAFVIASDALFTKAAKVAFLVFGPMMDVKLIFLYTTVLQRRVVIALLVGLALLTWGLTILTQQEINSLGMTPVAK